MTTDQSIVRTATAPATQTTTHTNQSFPYEWRTVDHNGETLVIHDVPEGLPECYRIAGRTLEAWVLAFADAVLYDGTIVEPIYDETTKRIRLTHGFAGTTERLRESKRLDDAVVLLERCDRVDLDEQLGPNSGGRSD